MIIEHFPELEADFRRYYLIDLPVALWGPEPITARKFRSYLLALPLESALLTQARPERIGWGNAEELLATLVELSHATWRVLVTVYSEKGASVPEPLRVPRPGQLNEPAAVTASPAEVKRFFGGGVRYVPRAEGS